MAFNDELTAFALWPLLSSTVWRFFSAVVKPDALPLSFNA